MVLPRRRWRARRPAPAPAEGPTATMRVAADHQRAVLDHLLAVLGVAHGHDPCVGEGEGIRWRVAGHGQPDRNAPRLGGFRQLGRRAGQEREGLVQRPREIAVAHHPVQRLRVARPVQVAADVGADPGDRQRLAVPVQLDRHAGVDQRGDVGVEQLGERDPLAVRAEADRVDVLEVVDLARVLAVHADRHQLLLHAAAGQVVHARAVGRELRRLAVVGHPHRGAATRGHHVDATVARPQAAGEAAAAGARIDDAAAVGRQPRVVVEAGFAGELAAAAAAGIHDVDRALGLVRPGGVEQGAAVGAEARLVLVHAAAGGQALWRAVGQALLPQLPDRVEHQGAAVGTGGDVADHLRREVAFADFLLEAQRRGHGLLDLGGERDPAGVAAGHVHPPQAALRPDHHRFRIRGPAVAGIGAEDRPGFLLVVAQAVPDRAHRAAGQVQHVQHRLIAHALDEGQLLAIGRGLRPDRAARRCDQRVDLAGLAVQALDRVDHPVRVLVVLERRRGADILGEIHMTPVGRDRRFAEVLLVVLALGQLQASRRTALFAAGVVQPQLAGTERALRGEMLAADEEAAIRRPRRRIEQAEVLLAHLHCVGTIGIDAPEIVAAAAVGGEGELAPVRRPARLDVPGRPRGDPRGRAAADRQQVQVAEQRERDAAAVGRDVDVHPGAFVGAEGDGLDRPVRGVDVPLRVLGRLAGNALAAGGVQRRRLRVVADRVERVLLQFLLLAVLAFLRRGARWLRILRGRGRGEREAAGQEQRDGEGERGACRGHGRHRDGLVSQRRAQRPAG
jgi:hypothetical protein